MVNFSNSDVFGEIKFSIEFAANEKVPENVFVPANKFLHILKKETKITMKDDYSLIVGNDIIKLQHFSDTSYEFPEFDETNSEDIILKNAATVAKFMKRALHYIDTNPDSPQSGVFFKENSVLSTDSISFYEWTSEEELPELSLPMELSKVFLSLPLKDNIDVLFKKNDVAVQIIYEDFLIQMGHSVILDIIDPTSDEFKSLFDFKEYIVFDYQKLFSELEFLQVFFQDAPDERIKITFTEDSVILSVEDYKQASSIVAFSEVSNTQYFNDQTVWLSGSSFLQAMKDLPGDSLRMAFAVDLPPVDFSSTSDSHV